MMRPSITTLVLGSCLAQRESHRWEREASLVILEASGRVPLGIRNVGDQVGGGGDQCCWTNAHVIVEIK